jgi:hypothetical protein
MSTASPERQVDNKNREETRREANVCWKALIRDSSLDDWLLALAPRSALTHVSLNHQSIVKVSAVKEKIEESS